MGRKDLLKSTEKKSSAQGLASSSKEAEKKKAILEGVPSFSGSIKANLEKIGLAQSTYYGWSQRYKADGVAGLNAGSPVPEKVWKNFGELKRKQGQRLETDTKSKVEEKRTMTSDKDKDRKKELLFKKFDEEPKPGQAKGGGTAPSDDEPVTTSTCSPVAEEPMNKTLKYAVAAFACVVGVLLIASFSNSSKFYFKHNKQNIELWQGRFAPMGERFVESFADPKMVKGVPVRDAYSKKQAFGVVFNYLVAQADDILNTGRTPDLKNVRSYLRHASKYAVSGSARQAIRLRLNSINFLVLSGKAELALAKGTASDFEAAKKFLTDAIPFASTDVQKDTVTKRLAAIEYAMATNKISKGEKQLAAMYREALNRHLRKAKEYNPEKSKEIDQEIDKIRKWLDEFDRSQVGKK